MITRRRFLSIPILLLSVACCSKRDDRCGLTADEYLGKVVFYAKNNFVPLADMPGNEEVDVILPSLSELLRETQGRNAVSIEDIGSLIRDVIRRDSENQAFYSFKGVTVTMTEMLLMLLSSGVITEIQAHEACVKNISP